MNDEEILKELAELFEEDNLDAGTALDALAWDSMAMLGVIAIAKKHGITISGKAIREYETVGDILTAFHA